MKISPNESYFDQTKRDSIRLSDETQVLRQKMKKLQLQLEILQSLKKQKKVSFDISKKSQNYTGKTQQINTPNKSNQHVRTQTQLKKFQNNKINDLMHELTQKNQNRMVRKLSLSKNSTLSNQKQGVQNLKDRLQEIDNLVQKPNKRKVLNLMALKDAKHTVDSNIFNVTVFQIINEQNQKYEMTKEIKELKDKLKQIQKKKRQKSQARKSSNVGENLIQLNPRRNIDTATGKIYFKSRTPNKKADQLEDTQYKTIFTQPNSIQLRRNSNPFTWNPQMKLTAKRQQNEKSKLNRGRFYSTVNVVNSNADQGQQKQQNNRKPLFKIMKKNNVGKVLKTEDQQNQKLKRVIQLLPQMKLQKMRESQNIPQDLIPEFRQYIKQKIIQIVLPPQPSTHDPQCDLQSLGRILFSLFGLYIEQQIKNKGTQYKVIKYKNCILFKLNEEKNIVWYFDGKFYFGGWEINLNGQGRKQGFGFQIIPLGYLYQGFFKNNKREGYGIMVNGLRSGTHRNMIYEGFWKDGLKHGKGYQAEDDLEYFGDFNEGVQTGQCKIKTLNTSYQGTIKQSVKVGKGHEILKNEDQYYGDYINGMFHGKGQYKWKTGAYFYGNFIQGIRQGKGIWLSNLTSSLFDSYNGQYEQNRKNGQGVYRWMNGTIYQGYFKNDLRHDQGIMRYVNGKTAKFIWKDGDRAYKIYSEEQEIYRRKGCVDAFSNKLDLQGQNQPQEEDLSKIDSPIQTISQLEKQTLFLYSRKAI